MTGFSRRELLTGAAALVLGEKFAAAEVISGKLPFAAEAASLPGAVNPEGWRFFSAAEVASIEAIVDRIIPPDPETPGGKEAGCAIFIDRQLAGGYGQRQGLYNVGPFQDGTKQQGPQSAKDPAQQYRAALATIDQHSRSQEISGKPGRPFAELTAEQQDAILKEIEDGSIKLAGLDGRKFFENLVTDVQQGFFADPLYGGNRNMCAWKMIGFPGARYDYRDWVSHHNEPYPHPPVSIQGRPEWTPKS
ncbi:MAG: gluconate 2-dehydrogenase subunit 3 family protein [Steroidobacteraceae bacterium]